MPLFCRQLSSMDHEACGLTAQGQSNAKEERKKKEGTAKPEHITGEALYVLVAVCQITRGETPSEAIGMDGIARHGQERPAIHQHLRTQSSHESPATSDSFRMKGGQKIVIQRCLPE